MVTVWIVMVTVDCDGDCVDCDGDWVDCDGDCGL